MDELSNIIIENEPLIYSIINKYSRYYDTEDLYQVAVMGIIKAYKNYKQDFNTKFTSYAYNYILGEILKYINDSKIFKIGKETRGLYKKINEAKTILTQKLMKEPSNYELSLFLEINEKVINDVINVNSPIDSLDREIKDEGKKLMLYDVVGENKDNIEEIFLHDEINKLSLEELKILKERYFNDKTQSEVAKELGITQVKVSREEQKILKKLSNSYQKVV